MNTHDNSRQASGRFLAVRQVVALLDLSERTVRQWIADGKLPVVRIAGSRAIRIPEEALRGLLKR